MRRVRGEREKVPVDCLVAHEMYNRGMGGVDKRDYERLARYSLELTCLMRKWYRKAFTAILDLVLANTYLIWKYKNKNSTNFKGKSHGAFMEILANELLEYHVDTELRVKTPRVFRQRGATSFSDSYRHAISTYGLGQGYFGAQKDQRNCFVCKVHTSKHFCQECEVTICTTIHDGYDTTCFERLHAENTIFLHAKKTVSNRKRRESEKRKKKEEERRTKAEEERIV
jgi:hypothetical protein